VTQSGLTVVADNTRTVSIKTRKVTTLAVIPVRAATELVKPGTTADVYSISSATAAAVETLGGGGGQVRWAGAVVVIEGGLRRRGAVIRLAAPERDCAGEQGEGGESETGAAHDEILATRQYRGGPGRTDPR